jgi:hypothetical protein
VVDNQAGIFDGFGEYRTPCREDLRRVLTAGLVAIDTNVLLNLYRYNPQTRVDLFSILRALEHRLWIPHQVISEFWENRESVIADHDGVAAESQKKVEDLQRRTEEEVRSWARRTALPSDRQDHLLALLDEAFNHVRNEMAALAAAAKAELHHDTNVDPVVQDLTALAAGKVGPPLTAREFADASSEGERRIAEQIPPGYMDAKKPGGRGIGDYLLWHQLLREATARKVDVLLVTADVKEDWWHRSKGETRGPRRELVREMANVAAVQFLMSRPEVLLRDAPDLLSVMVQASSVEDAERVDRISRISAPEPRSRRHIIGKLPEGRTGDYLETVRDMVGLIGPTADLEAYLDAFQTRFPTITNRVEARRRLRTLFSLGLAQLEDDHIEPTRAGEDLLSSDNALELLQRQFMSNIAGARELADLSRLNDLRKVKRILRQSPPADLSVTQSLLVYRWMTQLGLVTGAGANDDLAELSPDI